MSTEPYHQRPAAPRRGWLRHGNPPGDFMAAPRCGGEEPSGSALRLPSHAHRRLPAAWWAQDRTSNPRGAGTAAGGAHDSRVLHTRGDGRASGRANTSTHAAEVARIALVRGSATEYARKGCSTSFCSGCGRGGRGRGSRLFASTACRVGLSTYRRHEQTLESAMTAQWQGWEDLGGPITSPPAVASWGPGRLDVFAAGADGQLVHRAFDGEWDDWHTLGGIFKGGPAAVSWGKNRIDIFVQGMDDHLGHFWWNGEQWRGWQDLGGPISSPPAVASWESKRLDVFAAGPDGQLVHKRWNGTWNDWHTLGGTFKGAPAAVSWGTNRIDVFVQGIDAHLGHLWWADKKWHGWEDSQRQSITGIAWHRRGSRMDFYAACGCLMGMGATRRVLWRAYREGAFSTGVGSSVVGQHETVRAERRCVERGPLARRSVPREREPGRRVLGPRPN